MSNPSPAPSAAARPRRRRASRRVLLALAVVLAVVGAACEQMHPDNRAAPVPGVTNGQLPLSYLALNGRSCKVYDEAAESLRRMIAQAATDGVTLRPTSCYRDYAGQVAAREDWCSRGACHMAAVPGTSNHGWGKAIDFADQTGTLDWDSPGYVWLKTWGWHYGWMHPTVMEPGGPVPEPWHFEWIGDGGKMFPGKYFGIHGNDPPTVVRGQPFGALDWVGARPGEVEVSGWAIDPDTEASIPVHVYVGPYGFARTAARSRPDVAAAFPLFAAKPHGFVERVPVEPGRFEVCAFAINVAGAGTHQLLRCQVVDVPGPSVSAPAAVTSRSAPTSTAPPSTTTTTTPPPTNSTTTTTVDPPPTGSSTTTSTLAQGTPSSNR